MARSYEKFRARIGQTRIDGFHVCMYVCAYMYVDIISDAHVRIALLWHFIIYNNDV